MDRYVTISVDDGHPTDLRTADLLDKYGLAATFYLSPNNPERSVMGAAQIREVSKRFEIGGHTMNHVPVRSLPLAKAWSEINEGKIWLENVLGRRVISFCYPRGKFNARSAALVKQAGFLGARTLLLNLNEFPRTPFFWGVSSHACWHSKFIQVRHALLEKNFIGLRNFFQIYKASTEWQQHFLYALDHVEAHGGIAHLVLHSWEIADARDWGKLESIFKSICKRDSLSRVTNGALFEVWKRDHDEAESSVIRNDLSTAVTRKLTIH
jgi:peptidoglycan/xylan/chitin deacetylase (PgdA/CDA1 family)